MSIQHLKSALYDFVARYHEAGYFPSASVRIFNKNQTLAICSVGEAKQDSMFDVASLTKIATTTQILGLIDEQRLSFEDEIIGFFPEAEKDEYMSKRLKGITIIRLLTHTSSLPAWYPFYIWQGAEFWNAFKSAVINQLPTEGVVYSDLNFILLGKLIEKMRGMPLNDCLKIYLTEPLGISDEMMYLPDTSKYYSIIPSSYGNPIEMQMCTDRKVCFDRWRSLDEPITGMVNDGNCYYYFNGVSGHAGIFATANAYEQLCRFYMRSEKTLLQLAQHEQQFSPGRGIGFQTGTTYPHGCGHNGFTGTSIYFSTEYNIGVVAMTNRLFFKEPSGQNLGEFRHALHEMTFSVGAEL